MTLKTKKKLAQAMRDRWADPKTANRLRRAMKRGHKRYKKNARIGKERAVVLGTLIQVGSARFLVREYEDA